MLSNMVNMRRIVDRTIRSVIVSLVDFYLHFMGCSAAGQNGGHHSCSHVTQLIKVVNLAKSQELCIVVEFHSFDALQEGHCLSNISLIVLKDNQEFFRSNNVLANIAFLGLFLGS